MPPSYGSPLYWRTRFLTETNFEWLISSSTFLSLLRPYLPSAEIPILHLGSGTSDLHIHLYNAGYTNITNLDYEPLALERGKALEQDAIREIRMSYVEADVTNMQLGRKFEVAIDKSTADAVACGEGGVKRMAGCVVDTWKRGGSG